MPLPESPVRLTGPGLVLREWENAELPTLAKLLNEPDIADRSPFNTPFDLDAARHHLAMIQRTRAQRQRLHLAITTDGRTPRGEVILDLTRATIGYAVGAAHRGQRLALRSTRLLTDYAHHTLKLPRVLLEIEADNTPSTAIARALNFHPTEQEPEHFHGKRRSFVLHTWEHHAP